ncbi:MAG: hypothetical protein D6798_17270 [Deltaproteobacteria bacterium]|nr:MAG: hypothetical protein D6798_17270 [Deltaproteobacteria bacterium]
MAVACAPAGDVLQALGTVALESGGIASDDPAVDALLGGVAHLSAQGIAVDEALVLTMWKAGEEPVGELALPFSGDEEQARTLLDRLGIAPEPVPGAPGRWVGHDEDGDTRVRLVDGSLALSFNGSPPARDDLPVLDRELVAGLPDGPGCAAWVALSGDAATAARPIVGERGLAIAGFLPFQREGIGLVRVRSVGPFPQAMSQSGWAPVTGSGHESPGMVVTVGPGLADLLDDAELVAHLGLTPAQVRRVQRTANIGAGSTIALFGDPRGRDFVAVLPVDGTRGPTRAHKVSRRLRRLARRVGFDVLRSDDRSMVVSVGTDLVFVEVRDGRIYLAAHGPRALEAAEGVGEPWVHSEDLAWALRWPVAAWTGLGGPAMQRYPLKVQAGFRGVDDVLEVGIRVRTDMPAGMLGPMLARILAEQLATLSGADPADGDAGGGGDEAP